MTPQEFSLLLMSTISSVFGQFFLKVGALKLGRVTSSNLIGHVMKILTTPELLIGLACYGLGAIAYIMVLTRVKLSIAAPSASLLYVFSVLVGYFAFQEAISPHRLLGLAFIIFGVFLIARQR
ncbi:MAG: EamA family transporter [Cyanophyceae cyanobacterium]